MGAHVTSPVTIIVGPVMTHDKPDLYMIHVQVPGHAGFELEADHVDCMQLRGTPEDVLMYKLERVLESMDINNYNIKRVGYL
jgi:hypothetical protein